MFDAAAQPQVAATSTLLTALFAAASVMAHFGVCCRRPQDARSPTFVTTADRVLAWVYAAVAIAYDASIVYVGAAVRDERRWPHAPALLVFAWIAVNIVALLPVLVALRSRTRHRALLYAAYSAHATGVAVSVVAAAAADELPVGAWPWQLVTPALLVVVGAWITYRPPRVLRLDADRARYETRRQKRGVGADRDYMTLTERDGAMHADADADGSDPDPDPDSQRDAPVLVASAPRATWRV
ncbi:hypothetical protein LCGC14_2891180 [marine sediment metagenome]|uniref:Uncharacterized protein n=1 Tax=marine sediment metagenome TaxID=412755 RepID=A0A0F8XX67_9ZZZZ